MATKINNTTVFPITVPGDDDLLLGTDVSDTSNDPDGQTVNFKVEDVLQLTKNSAVWHPYDMVYFGDGNDGLIYDHGADGTVTYIETPVFEAGYDYAVYFKGVSPSGSATQPLSVKARATSSGTYGSRVSISSNITSSRTFEGAFYVRLPSLSRRVFTGEWLIEPHENFDASIAPSSIDPLKTGSADTIDRLEFDFLPSGFDAGQIYLWRRREFVSGS
jgi:hypothetical protein